MSGNAHSRVHEERERDERSVLVEEPVGDHLVQELLGAELIDRLEHLRSRACARACACVRARARACVRACVRACPGARIRVRESVCACVRACVHARAHKCVCVFTR